MQQLLNEFDGQKKIYEQRGLFYTTFLSNPDYIKRENLSFRFSLYQIPALMLDYFFRQQVNSLNQFLFEINESKLQFPHTKMKQNDKTDVSMPLFEFQQLYSRFCSRFGYVERQVIQAEK